MVCQGLLPLLGLYLLKLIVDTLTIATSSGTVAASGDRVISLVVMAAAVAIFTVAVQEVGLVVRDAQSQKLTDHVHGLLHTQSERVDLAYFETPDYFDTLHRAQAEGPYRPNRILESVVRMGQGGISIVGIGGLLLWFHWGLPILLFIVVVPGVWVKWRFSEKLYRLDSDNTRLERQSGYYHWLLTAAETAKEVRLLGLGRLFTARFQKARCQLRTGKINLSKRRGQAAAVAQGGAAVVTFGCFGAMALKTANGLFTLGDFVMFVQGFQKGMNALETMLSAGAELNENRLFLRHLYRFLDLSPVVVGPQKPVAVPVPFKKEITVIDLCFTYPGSDRRTLTDVSFSIRPGEVVALVGPNGSGKTTLAKLLCRLYDPETGSIEVDGADIRRFDPNEWRKNISIISQDYLQFHASAEENILFGDVHNPEENGRVVVAARKTGAHSFIEKLPEGYRTHLGKQLAPGVELSQGQWQKIALSRAFLRQGQLMILDEPTSALDADTEYQIFTLFRELAAGRTAIIISHRFSTVRMADRILVLENGRIVERGSHDALMNVRGRYARMFEKQVGMYGEKTVNSDL